MLIRFIVHEIIFEQIWKMLKMFCLIWAELQNDLGSKSTDRTKNSVLITPKCLQILSSTQQTFYGDQGF